MPTLITCLSTGKGTWTEVSRLLQMQKWNKVFIVSNSFGQENFQAPGAEFVLVDAMKNTTSQLVSAIKKQLKDKISDFEVAVNISSGSGKEHIAIIEAVLELGLNFRLVTVENNNFVSLGLEKN